MVPRSWQDKTIYFILIDRFRNGDRSNDDFGKGEYGAGDNDRFQGGDLRGIIEKLPHIKELGFDAIWITPPVHNQWINPYISTRGYHGYWAYDFTAVDPHFGTLEDYRELVGRAHQLGLKVIQDIVVNHTGNYFTVDAKDYDPKRPERNWREAEGALPPESGPKAPRDPVFRMNNPNIAEHRRAAVYHFTPNIADFKNRKQTLTYAMGDLDDIDTLNPAAANRLKEIYRFWIEQVGVDGFRVDTVFYTPEKFYENFLYSADSRNPGIKRFAERRRIRDFFVFGEVWSYDYRAINRYVRQGRVRRLDSAIDLPLNEALGQVFYRKAATSALKGPLEARRDNANLWVNFLDNHDVERMAGRAGWAAVRQSLVALFTLPGIPCITYGTEAGLIGSRQNMFEDGHYDHGSKEAVFLKTLIELRRRRRVLRAGRCRVERTALSCGLLSYTVADRGQACAAIFNTSPDRMVIQLPPARFKTLLASHEGLDTSSGSMVLPPESYFLLERLKGRYRSARGWDPMTLRPLARGPVAGVVEARFSATKLVEGERRFLLSDDNYDRKLPIEAGSNRLTFDTSELGNGRHSLRLLAEHPDGRRSFSNERIIEVRNPYRLLAQANVQPGNKGGINGKIHPPAEASYDGQVSMRSVEAATSGRDLRLTLRMDNVTADWNPPNGYDHVYFNVFLGFPGRRGAAELPKLGYRLPDFEYHSGFLLHGWGDRSFAAAGSTADGYGPPLPGEIEQSADLATKTVAFTFSSRFFDGLKSLRGVRVFVSTWDGYLGDFRGIASKREDWNFYTLEAGAERLPKVFDWVTLTL